MQAKKHAEIWQERCVACGSCEKICPLGAVYIKKGMFAEVNITLCAGCGLCARECPASLIAIKQVKLSAKHGEAEI